MEPTNGIIAPESVPYGKRSYYPHMAEQDAPIWERFMVAFPDMYDVVAYDVKVGRVPDFVANDPDEAQRAQAPLYQRKIDVVGRKDAQIDLIEVKPVATTATVGQIVGYRHLFMRDFLPAVQPKAIIVAGATDPDTIEVAAAQGVVIVVV